MWAGAESWQFTLGGLAEAADAAKNFSDLIFVPGVEISARFSGGMLHILGLGVEPQSPQLQRTLDELLSARNERNPRIVQKLTELGMPLTMEDVRREAGGGVLGRLHIAQAMVTKNYVASTQQAFARWIGDGKPAYVEKERLEPAGAIAAIHAAGGLAIVAHPIQLRCPNRLHLERVVREHVESGLDGIEAYHSDHSPEFTRICLDLARRLGLCVTGGSDFHGLGKPGVCLGRPRVPVAALDDRCGEVLFRFGR